MIDFHSHILPEMDDGSKSVEQTIEMLKMSYEQGVTDIVATPHFYPASESPERFFKKRQKSIDKLLDKCDFRDMPNVYVGAEVGYFEGIAGSTYTKSLCTEGTDYILIEMPFEKWDLRTIKEICAIKNTGINPIIAHVERYLVRHNEKLLKEFIYHDIMIQSNADFFSGKSSKKKALKMLAQRTVKLLGTDSHNLDDRKPNMKGATDVIEKAFGDIAIEDINSIGRWILKDAIKIQDLKS